MPFAPLSIVTRHQLVMWNSRGMAGRRNREILRREVPLWAEFALESGIKSLRQNKLGLTIKLLRTFSTTPSWTDSEEEWRNVNDFISQFVSQIVGSETDFRWLGRLTSDVGSFRRLALCSRFKLGEVVLKLFSQVQLMQFGVCWTLQGNISNGFLVVLRLFWFLEFVFKQLEIVCRRTRLISSTNWLPRR